jgi:hypothetical protein
VKFHARALMIISIVSLAGNAFALNVDSGGVGQVLLFPYYTTNANQDTLVTIANTQFRPVLAKVRFLEGLRGRPVLDVDVLLRPHSTWAAAVTLAATGGARLIASDPACTSPAVPVAGLEFTASGYDGSGQIPADDGPHEIERTREGFIEVIGGASVQGNDPNNPVHVDCGTFFDQLSAGSIALTAPDDISGAGAVIDVGSGTYYMYTATALADFTKTSLYDADWGPLHPSLADANDNEDPDGHPIARFHATSAGSPTMGEVSSPYEDGVDATTAVLMADSLQNDVILDPALSARTDWVLTMPTRRFYVDSIYPEFGSDGEAVTSAPVFALNVYDRSGASQSFSGGPMQLRHDITVLGFSPSASSTSPVLGSTLVTPFATAIPNGSARMDLGGPRNTSSGHGVPTFPIPNQGGIYGSPIIGFMAYKVVNAQAQPGLLANYGAGFAMRRTACITGTRALNPFICRH